MTIKSNIVFLWLAIIALVIALAMTAGRVEQSQELACVTSQENIDKLYVYLICQTAPIGE